MPSPTAPTLRDAPPAHRVLLVGEVAGLESIVGPPITFERAPTLRLALAFLVLVPFRLVITTQHVDGAPSPRAGEWLLAWTRNRYPSITRILVADPWDDDLRALSAASVADVTLSALTPLAELADVVRALVLGDSAMGRPLGWRPPDPTRRRPAPRRS